MIPGRIEYRRRGDMPPIIGALRALAAPADGNQNPVVIDKIHNGKPPRRVGRGTGIRAPMFTHLQRRKDRFHQARKITPIALRPGALEPTVQFLR